MDKQLPDIGVTGPKHRSPVRRRRRLGATAGALVTGAALVLGSAGLAEAGVHTYIPSGKTVPLYDNCGTGFTGSVKWTNTKTADTVTVKFTPPAKQAGKVSYVAADIDVRGDHTDARGRNRVFRLRADVETLTLGTQMVKTFKASEMPADIKVWRVSVGAVEEGPLATEVHALEAEDDPAACD
jgi:hypothetical protein